MNLFGSGKADKKKLSKFKKADTSEKEVALPPTREMMRINLLPWREELRKERETRFAVSAGIAVAVTALLFLAVHMYFAGLIDYQSRRNDYLRSEIKKAEEKIKEIKELEKKREQLFQRMEIIQKLQSSRPEVVHLFDELVKKIPAGVYFTSFSQKGRKITIKGIAQSQARVSTLMRRLDDSEWLENASLEVIQTIKKVDQEYSEFTLHIQQEAQKKEGEEESSQ